MMRTGQEKEQDDILVAGLRPDARLAARSPSAGPVLLHARPSCGAFGWGEIIGPDQSLKMPQRQSQVAGGVAAVAVVTFQGLADLRHPEGPFTLMQGQISHGARSPGSRAPAAGEGG